MSTQIIIDSNIRPPHIRRMKHFLTYLTESGVKQSEFAERVGITQGMVSRLAHNLASPSLELAVAIERETGGAIKASDWVDGGDNGRD
jgi:transcriptional regulator with XRE-family HTH domain